MDLQAAKLHDAALPRWPKVAAFVFFAFASGLLIGSLAKAHAEGARGPAFERTLAGN